MSQSPEHPQHQELVDFGHGKLSPDQTSQIEEHLDHCAECNDTLLNLADDTFTGLVRSLPEPTDQSLAPESSAVETPDGTEPDGEAAASPVPGEVTDGAAVNDESSHPATMLVQSGVSIEPSELPDELRDHPRYRIVDQIGSGGMGDVYRAEHRLMNRSVALKLINSQLVKHPQAVERFRREVQAAAQLTHPNIVTAFDAEQAGDAHFLAMEFVEGTDLATVVKHRGALPVTEGCECIRQAAEGLQHAHEKGMVHRDIKPHNLMLSPDGQVRILDFGLAGFATESAIIEADPTGGTDGDTTPLHLTTFGSVMGTPDYIAPEQARDAHSADIRADIYSLGCTLCYLLSGKAPFAADSVVDKLKAHAEQDPPVLDTLRDDVPSELADIVSRMMAKDPADRIQSPIEVATALAPFTEQHTEPAVATVKAAGNRWTLTRVCAAAVITLLAGVIFVVTTQGNFEVRSEVDGVQVTVSKDGDQFRVLDVNSGTSVFWLNSGEFKVTARGDVDVMVNRDNVRVTWMGKQVIRVSPATVKREPSDQTQPRKHPASAESLKLVRTLEGHTESVTAIDVSPDGRLAVSGGHAKNEAVRLWNLQNGETLHVFDFGANVSSIDIAPDGRHVAVGGGNRNLRIWNLETFEEYRTLQMTGLVRGLCFSPDSRFILTSSTDGQVQYWNIEEGSVVHSFPVVLKPENHCHPEITNDGRYGVVCPSNEPPVTYVFDLKEGKLTRRFQVDRENRSSGLIALSNDASTLLIPHWGKSVSVCDFATGKTKRVLSIPGVTNAAFLPDNRHAVCNGRGVSVSIWDVVTGKQVATLDAQKYQALGLAVSPDGKTILSGHMWSSHLPPIDEQTRVEDFAIRVWRTPEGVLPESREITEVTRFMGHSKVVTDVAFSRDGKRILSVGHEQSLRVWDAHTGQLHFAIKTPRGANSVAISPDGRIAATGVHQGEVMLWDLERKQLVRRYKGEMAERVDSGAMTAVAFSPDGTKLAGCGLDGIVWVWDVASDRQLARLAGNGKKLEAVHWSPDGKQIIAGGFDWRVSIWEVATSQLVKRSEEISQNGRWTALSPDGKYLVACDRILEIESLQPLRKLELSSGVAPVDVRVTPDGRHVVGGCNNGSLVVWDFATGRQVVSVAHAGHVTNEIDLSPDGRFVVTGGGVLWAKDNKQHESTGDFVIRLWRLPVNVWSQTDDARADGPGRRTEQSKMTAAKAVSLEWLAHFDDADFATCWDTMTNSAKANSTRNAGIKKLLQKSRTLGAAISRVVRSIEFASANVDAPARYVVATFDTRFATAGSSVERVSIVLDPDGRWRVAGHGAEPRPVPPPTWRPEYGTGPIKAGVNLVNDPSLEGTAPGQLYPKTWGNGNLIPKDAWRFEVVEGGRTGKRGWMIEGDGEAATVPSNRQPVDRAFRYAARAWVKVESGMARLGLLCFDKNRRYIDGRSSSATTARIGEWHRLTMVDDFAKHPDAAYVSLALIMVGPGKVVFDDLELIPFDANNLPESFEAEYGAPTHDAAVFDQWVGRWETTVEHPRVDGGQRTIKGSAVVRKILDDRFLLWHWTSDTGNDEYLRLTGFDEHIGAYRDWGADSNGLIYERSGSWNASTSTLTLHKHSPETRTTESTTDRFASKDRVETLLTDRNHEGQTLAKTRATWIRKSGTVEGDIPVSTGAAADTNELAVLQKLAGTWATRQTLKPSIWEPDGKTESITDRVEWVLGGRALLMSGFDADEKLLSIALMTWDPQEKSYHMVFFSPGTFGAEWSISWHEPSKEFRWKATDMPTGWVGTAVNRWLDDDTFENQVLIKDEQGRVLMDSHQKRARVE